MAHVLQASVFIPLVKCVCDKQNKKACFGLKWDLKVTSKCFVNEM